MNKIIKSAVLGSVLAMISVLPVMGQVSNFTICNGTGKTITDIEIKSQGGSCELRNLSLRDQQSLVVSLPQQMRNSGAFDLVLKYGGKTAKTRQSITLRGQGGTLRFVAHIKGKGSSLPFTAGAMSGGAAVAGIGATGAALSSGTIMLGQAVGAGAIVEALAMAGAVVGGGMVAGVAVVAAVPVAIGAGVFALVSLFSADTLILTQVN
jgi:hypothetical protein